MKRPPTSALHSSAPGLERVLAPEAAARLGALLAHLAPLEANARSLEHIHQFLAEEVSGSQHASGGDTALFNLAHALGVLDEMANGSFDLPLEALQASQLEELLQACCAMAPRDWRPWLETLTLQAYEALLYAEHPARSTAWQSLRHPWASSHLPKTQGNEPS